MKRLLLPLLAAFAIPNAVNAEATYLTCDLYLSPVTDGPIYSEQRPSKIVQKTK